MGLGRKSGLIVAGAVCLATSPVSAATLSGGAGIDYQAGPEAQSYRAALLFASVDFAPGDVAVAAVRFNDSRVGPGWGGFGNVGVRARPSLTLRVIGVRTVADADYRAWRLRAGPEFRIASDVVLGPYYLRLRDNADGRFGAAGVELSIPVLPNVSAQLGSSYGRWAGGETTLQATVAGSWSAIERAQLLFEVDAGRNVTTTSTTASSGGGIWGGLPIVEGLGNGDSGGTETRNESRLMAAGLLGIRILIP